MMIIVTISDNFVAVNSIEFVTILISSLKIFFVMIFVQRKLAMTFFIANIINNDI